MPTLVENCMTNKPMDLSNSKENTIMHSESHKST